MGSRSQQRLAEKRDEINIILKLNIITNVIYISYMHELKKTEINDDLPIAKIFPFDGFFSPSLLFVAFFLEIRVRYA